MGPDRHSLHPGSLTCPSEGWGQGGGCVRDRVRGRCVWGQCVWGRCVCGDGVCGDSVWGDGACGDAV